MTTTTKETHMPEPVRCGNDPRVQLMPGDRAAVETFREYLALRKTLSDLAPMFEGLYRLLVTSSRDWGEYRVDAWLYAVLVGWDCEEDHEHTSDCGRAYGAMREQQQRHGWSDEAVAKARRYRAAVRAAASLAREHCAHPDVQGRCPACGGESLFLGSGGYVTCSRIDCPEPDAASTALERPDREEGAPCSAGLIPLGRQPAEPCIRRGPHTAHLTATGTKFYPVPGTTPVTPADDPS